ncbi:MAG TPA: EAL domain-containing protein [Blastocatellia bacterium]|nr:EAL domain-containing protein [Blastocatellia bacterium]
MNAPKPEGDSARIEALGRYDDLEHSASSLKELAQAAAGICAAPIALLSFVEAKRVRHRVRVGTLLSESSRDGSFTAWAILEPGPFVVSNSSKDARFKDSPLVAVGDGVQFYAGAPLRTLDGHAIGALEVMDRQPRELDAAQLKALAAFAAAAMTHLELGRKTQDLEHSTLELDRALESLKASEERYALVVRSANDGLWDWDLETNEIHFCPRWKAMLGYEEDEIGGRPDEWFSRVHPDDIESLQTELTSHLMGLSPHFQKEHRVRDHDGHYRWMLSRGLAVWDSNRHVYRMSGSVTDVTDQRETEKQLLHNAFHDVLTGLPNRALFMDRLKRSLNRAKNRDDYLFAVLFLDVDRFKVVNDSLGHQIGDQLLIAMARRLEGCLRPGDMVARLGGDEFAIIVDHIKNVSDATQAAERIQEELGTPFTLSGHEVFAAASIGIALNLTPCDLPEDILRNADTAMYRAKDRGRACYELFEKGMHARAVALMHLETDLRRALGREEFRLHYQPIISIETWRISGFEALLRWQHPEHGIISPLTFIPLAEETGLIIPIGQWVLREACRQARAWQEQFPSDPPLSISVNLSGKQFLQSDLIERIEEILTETGLQASSLEIEITESAIIENIDSATLILRQLKTLGIRLSLDDFGTGYSSLSYLHRFPIDTIKIDRSFVSRMNSPKNSEIVRTIVTLAGNLGLSVIAEGVETREQIIQLTGLNCDLVQGYLLSKPIDGAAMRDLIEEIYERGLGAHEGAA